MSDTDISNMPDTDISDMPDADINQMSDTEKDNDIQDDDILVIQDDDGIDDDDPNYATEIVDSGVIRKTVKRSYIIEEVSNLALFSSLVYLINHTHKFIFCECLHKFPITNLYTCACAYTPTHTYASKYVYSTQSTRVHRLWHPYKYIHSAGDHISINQEDHWNQHKQLDKKEQPKVENWKLRGINKQSIKQTAHKFSVDIEIGKLYWNYLQKNNTAYRHDIRLNFEWRWNWS